MASSNYSISSKVRRYPTSYFQTKEGKFIERLVFVLIHTPIKRPKKLNSER